MTVAVGKALLDRFLPWEPSGVRFVPPLMVRLRAPQPGGKSALSLSLKTVNKV